MTIDERLEAQARSLKRQIRKTQELRRSIRKLRDSMKESSAGAGKMKGGRAELETHQDLWAIVHNVVDALGKTNGRIDRLTRIAESHANRRPRWES
jgi:hypothetical protein